MSIFRLSFLVCLSLVIAACGQNAAAIPARLNSSSLMIIVEMPSIGNTLPNHTLANHFCRAGGWTRYVPPEGW